jgi:hypothetical protein
MTIDWSPIAAGASAVGAIAALGVYFAGKQIRTSVVIAKDTQDIAKQTQGIDVLLRLRDEWDAETMQEKKQRAASLLLRNLRTRVATRPTCSIFSRPSQCSSTETSLTPISLGTPSTGGWLISMPQRAD